MTNRDYALGGGAIVLGLVIGNLLAVTQIYPPGSYHPGPHPTPSPSACPTPEPTPDPSPSATPTPAPTPTPTPTPSPTPPALSLVGYKANMDQYGRKFCEMEKAAVDAWAGGTGKIDACMSYYDGEEVYLNIAEFDTANAGYWKDCSAAVEKCYRGKEVPAGQATPGSVYPWGYVHGNKGSVPGYWGFSQGMKKDFDLSQDTESKSAIFLLSEKEAYCPDFTATGGLEQAGYSREVARCVSHYINAELLGHPHRTRQETFVGFMFNHIEQWVSGTYRAPNPWSAVPAASGMYYFQPFMGGLTMRSLIMQYEVTSDPALKQKIYEQVKRLAIFIQSVAWDPNSKAWWYENYAPTLAELPAKAGAPDLNMIILPAYGWLYSIDHDLQWISIGDAAFEGGVKGAWFGDDKHFNQNYTWSFNYLKWRSMTK